MALGISPFRSRGIGSYNFNKKMKKTMLEKTIDINKEIIKNLKKELTDLRWWQFFQRRRVVKEINKIYTCLAIAEAIQLELKIPDDK